MRKITFLALTFLFVAKFCFAQENGVVTYTITHNWVKKMATCEYISQAERERSAYVWGGNNEYEYQAELQFNASEYRFELKESEEAANYRWRKEAYIIYRDFAKGEIFDITTLLSKEYITEDTLICQNWKIKSDMKEVAGHICMNATFYDTVKGKEVVAWFALDLPVSIGPDRYCGLPGMILEINEGNGAVVYTATTVLLSSEKVEITKPTAKKNTKRLTCEAYNKIIIDYINECIKMQRPYFWNIAF